MARHKVGRTQTRPEIELNKDQNMPKKFQGENTKAVAARMRRAEAKTTENEKREREKEDAYWADDDKQAQKKMQRKNEQEQKRQQQLEKKLENQKIHDEEMVRFASTVKTKQQIPQKITQAQIEQQKQLEIIRQKEEEKQRILEQKKIIVPDANEEEELHENINRLQIEGNNAVTVDEAIELLKEGGSGETMQDRHPEKRLKAAYAAFEEKRIPLLKEEHPTFRLSQLKQLVKKEWQKSVENPLNQKIMNIIK